MKKSQPLQNPYKRLYNKPLSTEQMAEMRFNLINFVETLIQMDIQHKEWLKQQTHAEVTKQTKRPSTKY